MFNETYSTEMVVTEVRSIGVERLLDIYKTDSSDRMSFSSFMDQFFSTIKISVKLVDVELPDLINLRKFCKVCSVSSIYEKFTKKLSLPDEFDMIYDKSQFIYNTLKEEERKILNVCDGDGVTYETLFQLPFLNIRFSCDVEVTGNRIFYMVNNHANQEIDQIENAREGFTRIEQYLANRFMEVFLEFSSNNLKAFDMFTSSVMYGRFYSYLDAKAVYDDALSIVQTPYGEVNFLGTNQENVMHSIGEIKKKMFKEGGNRMTTISNMDHICVVRSDMRMFLLLYLYTDFVISHEWFPMAIANLGNRAPVQYENPLTDPMDKALKDLQLVIQNFDKSMVEAFKTTKSRSNELDAIAIATGLNCMNGMSPISYIIKASSAEIDCFMHDGYNDEDSDLPLIYGHRKELEELFTKVRTAEFSINQIIAFDFGGM